MANYIDSTVDDVKYHIATQDFDGPIDLLVKMVRESSIDIMQIFVSDITTQYVNYVRTLKELNYEYVSHFIVMASILIEIKTFHMMPMPEDEDDSYRIETEQMEEAIFSEVEQRLITSAPEKLHDMEVTNVFYNDPVYDKEDYKLLVKGLDLNKLLAAYRLILEKTEITDKIPAVTTIEKERFSVADKTKELKKEIREKKRINFFSLFSPNYTKSELLNVFLAILMVVKSQTAYAEQNDFNGDIELIHNDAKDDPTRDEEITEEFTNEVKESN